MRAALTKRIEQFKEKLEMEKQKGSKETLKNFGDDMDM